MKVIFYTVTRFGKTHRMGEYHHNIISYKTMDERIQRKKKNIQ